MELQDGQVLLHHQQGVIKMVARPQFLPEDYAAIVVAVQTIPGAIVYYQESTGEDDRLYDVVVEGVEKKAVKDALRDVNLDNKIKIKNESYKNKTTKTRIVVYTILPKD